LVLPPLLSTPPRSLLGHHEEDQKGCELIRKRLRHPAGPVTEGWKHC
jgi:hypothetical protein